MQYICLFEGILFYIVSLFYLVYVNVKAAMPRSWRTTVISP